MKSAIKRSDYKILSKKSAAKVNENNISIQFMQIVNTKAYFTEETNASRKDGCFEWFLLMFHEVFCDFLL